MNNKIKISWEVTDNWNKVDFRAWIKYLLSLEDIYEVFIISNDDSSSYILRIATELGLDSQHTIITNFTNDKVQAITDNHINIHLDNLQSFVILVDSTTEAYGVLVDNHLSRYYVKSQYIIDFETAQKLVERDMNGETN